MSFLFFFRCVWLNVAGSYRGPPHADRIGYVMHNKPLSPHCLGLVPKHSVFVLWSLSTNTKCLHDLDNADRYLAIIVVFFPKFADMIF